MFVYLRIGVWAFLVPALYAWFWCAVILLLRGFDNPRQKYLLVQQQNNQTMMNQVELNPQPNTTTTGLAPINLDDPSPDNSEDFV